MANSKTGRIAPSVQFVRSLEGTYYLLREAAELLGVSHRTLRTYLNGPDKDLLGPSFCTYLGKIKIYLYTDDDIERLRKHFEEQKVVYPATDPGPTYTKGRPPKWTEEQRKIRQRKFSQVHYYKTQADKHVNNGEFNKAKKCLDKVRSIQKQLKEQDIQAIMEK